MNNENNQNIEKNTNKSLWKKLLCLKQTYKLADKISIISFNHSQIFLLICSFLLLYLLILNSHVYIKLLSIIYLFSFQICILRKNLNTDNILYYGIVFIAILTIQVLFLILFNTLIVYFINNEQINIIVNRFLEIFIYLFIIPINILLLAKTSDLKVFLPKNYFIFIKKNKILLIIQSFIFGLIYLFCSKFMYSINTLFLPVVLFVFYLFFNIVLKILLEFVED